MSLRSPLRPILRNGKPLLKFLLEMPLLASAFSSALPHVICGQPTGREFATLLVNNFRGARLMGSQPNQTCSEGCPFLFLYVTGVCLCIWGVLTRLD